MQLVENPVKRPFETQHNIGQDPQIITCRILFGNYAFKLFAEKFEGNTLSTHAAKLGRDPPLASTRSLKVST
jgi:hypothetical protein